MSVTKKTEEISFGLKKRPLKTKRGFFFFPFFFSLYGIWLERQRTVNRKILRSRVSDVTLAPIGPYIIHIINLFHFIYLFIHGEAQKTKCDDR